MSIWVHKEGLIGTWFVTTVTIPAWGLMLYFSDKIKYFQPPNEFIDEHQKFVLTLNALPLITFIFYKSKIRNEQNFTKRFFGYHICWFSHCAIAVMGFVITELAENGNSFYFVVNSTTAILANIMMYPKDAVLCISDRF